MMLFWIIVAAMLLAAVAILAPALLRSRNADDLDRDQQNVVIARERLAELETELSEGALTREQYDEAKRELEQACCRIWSGRNRRKAGRGRPAASA